MADEHPFRLSKPGAFKPRYEYHTPMSYGGPAATYLISNPYNGSPCDYRIIAVCFGGLAGTAVTAILSDTSFWTPPGNAAAPPSLTNISDKVGGGVRGFVFQTAMNAIFQIMGPWAPMPNQLWLGCTDQTSIILDFRRMIERPPIPAIPAVHSPDLEEQVNITRERNVAEWLAKKG